MSRMSNDTLISAPVDLSANWTSEAIPLLFLDTYSIICIFSGVPILGVLHLEISNDPPNVTPTNWITFENSQQTISAAGDHTWNIRSAGHNFVRVLWTPDGGGSSGTLDYCRFNAKGV